MSEPISNNVARDTNQAIDLAKKIGCIDRGEGFKPMHIYIDGSGKCCCGNGPNLNEQRMK